MTGHDDAPTKGDRCSNPECGLCDLETTILVWLLAHNDHDLSVIVLESLAFDLARAGFNPPKEG